MEVDRLEQQDVLRSAKHRPGALEGDDVRVHRLSFFNLIRTTISYRGDMNISYIEARRYT